MASAQATELMKRASSQGFVRRHSQKIFSALEATTQLAID